MIVVCSLLKISRIGFAVEILDSSIASTRRRTMMGHSEASAQWRMLPRCESLPSYCGGVSVREKNRGEAGSCGDFILFYII